MPLATSRRPGGPLPGSAMAGKGAGPQAGVAERVLRAVRMPLATSPGDRGPLPGSAMAGKGAGPQAGVAERVLRAVAAQCSMNMPGSTLTPSGASTHKRRGHRPLFAPAVPPAQTAAGSSPGPCGNWFTLGSFLELEQVFSVSNVPTRTKSVLCHGGVIARLWKDHGTWGFSGNGAGSEHDPRELRGDGCEQPVKATARSRPSVPENGCHEASGAESPRHPPSEREGTELS
ncbi:hypothetical protein MDA_GLEAN10021417 [Myotis davidii]|uniref:Uncharacterized protein n=1 Tax=Myotis davidii TaxID=225400 RepID=L5LTX6_MYODS|nr:hypothetical protein MDA_GLEAN10021417 [Myotis davidii]